MYVPLEENMGVSSVPLWKSVLVVFVPSFFAFVFLDVVWISLVAGNIYKAVLGDVLRPTPGIVPGLLAWLCIVATVYLFALPTSRSAATALRQGFLLGVGIYGTYEFTNLSVLVPWTWELALVDTAWGAVACAIACFVQLWLQRRLAQG